MERLTLEEFVWENWNSLYDGGSDFLDEISTGNREVMQLYFGIFPYQQHSVRMISKYLKRPSTTIHRQIRVALLECKELFKKKLVLMGELGMYPLPTSVRRKIMERDGFKCAECGNGGELEVHHKIPRREKGGHIETNLITLCKKCHLKKTKSLLCSTS